MTNADYKPRLGFDIRVKPPKAGRKAKAWRPPTERVCEFPGCKQPATVQVAKSPRETRERLWFCAEHAAAHNKSWNYFDGLSAEEAQKEREKSMYGDRPTWSLGKNERARAAAKARGPNEFDDAHGVLGGAAKAPVEPKRRLPRLQAKALETLELSPDAKPAEIRSRYAELLRRYHPDANGGDRSAERQLQEVVKAHQILKKAGFC